MFKKAKYFPEDGDFDFQAFLISNKSEAYYYSFGLKTKSMHSISVY